MPNVPTPIRPADAPAPIRRTLQDHGTESRIGLFYPLFGWPFSPIIAAAAMALSSVSVIGNALRLRTLRL